MKFFIDSANISEIEEINDCNLICGVTTNPSLIAKEKRDFSKVVKEITSIVDGPISAEPTSLVAEEMVSEALQLAEIHPNVVIKLPITFEGLKACKTLTKQGIKVNITLVFSVNQALMAVNAGASYVSPFVGRMEDIGSDGIALIEEISAIFDYYDLECEIIAASIRNNQQVRAVALAGADIATIPYKVFKEMIKHPLSAEGIERFVADYEKNLKEVK